VGSALPPPRIAAPQWAGAAGNGGGLWPAAFKHKSARNMSTVYQSHPALQYLRACACKRARARAHTHTRTLNTINTHLLLHTINSTYTTQASKCLNTCPSPRPPRLLGARPGEPRRVKVHHAHAARSLAALGRQRKLELGRLGLALPVGGGQARGIRRTREASESARGRAMQQQGESAQGERGT
jgi:hypothetical protein